MHTFFFVHHICFSYQFFCDKSVSSNWVRKREDKIVAKGKGELLTYWLEVKSNSSGCQSSRSSESGTGTSRREDDAPGSSAQDQAANSPRKSMKLCAEKTERLIDWNSDVLCRLLQQILGSRECTGTIPSSMEFEESFEIGTNPFDEVKEIIALPQLKVVNKNRSDGLDVQVPKHVADQLRDYVSHIAAMYNDNKFHNFEHVRTSIVFVCNIFLRQANNEHIFVCVCFFFRGTYVSVVHDT
jgi:hypothetical protein